MLRSRGNTRTGYPSEVLIFSARRYFISSERKHAQLYINVVTFLPSGPHITVDENAVDSKTVEDVTTNKLAWKIAELINSRVPGVEVNLSKGDICYVGVQKATENRPASILVR